MSLENLKALTITKKDTDLTHRITQVIHCSTNHFVIRFTHIEFKHKIAKFSSFYHKGAHRQTKHCRELSDLIQTRFVLDLYTEATQI